MNGSYYATNNQVPTNVGVGLNLPATILGLPTWLVIVGVLLFYLKHKGKL